MAVLRLVDQISSELDKGNITVGVFIDLSKVFDTIDHSILRDKLQMYGIWGKVIDWLRSYLTDRSQYVGIGKNQSNKKRIKCSVPQGSILGPLLFIIYINDILNASTILSMFLLRTILIYLNMEEIWVKYVQPWTKNYTNYHTGLN